MLEFYCPKATWDIVKADGKVDAWNTFRCGDCSEKNTCGGPVVKEGNGVCVTAQKKAERKGRASKSPTSSAEGQVIPLPGVTEKEAESDAACKVALLKLCERTTQIDDSRKRADEFVGKFYNEIACTRAKGVGWKPITRAAREYGYHFGWNAIEKAFKRLESKTEG